MTSGFAGRGVVWTGTAQGAVVDLPGQARDGAVTAASTPALRLSAGVLTACAGPGQPPASIP